MAYTGHHKLEINGDSLIKHVRVSVEQECRFYGVPMPTDEQIAAVISALRMHHTLVHASEYDYSELHKREDVTTFYPVQSSIGRYFRDAAGEFLREAQLKRNEGK